MTPKRVLFAIPALDRGGPDRVFFELLRGLDRRRYQPAIAVSTNSGDYLGRLPRDIDIHVIARRGPAGRYPVYDAARLVRRLRPDLVISTLRMNVTMGLAKRFFPRRTRLIIRQANDFSADFAQLLAGSRLKHRVAKHVIVAALRQADAIICQSDAMRADVGRTLGATAPPLFAISNPIDVDAAQAEAEATPAPGWGQPSLLAAGRLAPQKGHDVLIAALALVVADYPQLKLRLLGQGPDEAHLRAMIAAQGLASHVEMAGFSNNVLPQQRRAKLFVLASRYEGFPNAALEALAVGTPVVLTDCPGANREIVKPGFNGRLATSVTPSAFAEALRTALAELPTYDRSGISADARARFGVATIISRYQARFDDVLGLPQNNTVTAMSAPATPHLHEGDA